MTDIQYRTENTHKRDE